MNACTIVFKANADTGVPHLHAPPGLLSTTERGELENELRDRYDQLVHCESGRTVELQTRIGRLPFPPTFRLEIERHSRLPTLYFHPCTDVALPFANGKVCFDESDSQNVGEKSPSLSSHAESSWQKGFKESLDELLAACDDDSLEPVDRISLSFAIRELHQFGEAKPELLLSVLTAGYLAFAEGVALSECDEDRASFYVLAGRGLSAICGDFSSPWETLRDGPASILPPEGAFASAPLSSIATIRKVASRVVNVLFPHGMREDYC